MTEAFDIDVLVVGLGPAGAMAARAAAQAGLRVIGVDRKKRAGVPVQCAEFVPAMLGPMFDSEQRAAIGATRRQHISSMSTFVLDAAPHFKPEFPGHMIDRAEFDAALVAAASKDGAECRFDIGLRALDTHGSAHLTDGTRIRARVIIGADGPRSLPGRAVGQVNEQIAETRQISVPLLQPFEATDIFLSASLPGGYAWLFPKGDRANLGLGVAPAWRHLLKPSLQELHAQLVEEERVGAEIYGHTGGAIPVGGMLRASGKLDNTLVLLAGDAAGLTNPVTGAGINAAVVSGKLAGEAAVHWRKGRATAADDYIDEIEALFKGSLDRAVERRTELMDIYNGGQKPDAAMLQRTWIAFPEYWAA